MPRSDRPSDQPDGCAPDDTVEELYRLRRSTYAFVSHYGGAYWAEYRELAGQLQVPPSVAALPAAQQPEALAITEASRLARAELYLLDKAATQTAAARTEAGELLARLGSGEL